MEQRRPSSPSDWHAIEEYLQSIPVIKSPRPELTVMRSLIQDGSEPDDEMLKRHNYTRLEFASLFIFHCRWNYLDSEKHAEMILNSG